MNAEKTYLFPIDVSYDSEKKVWIYNCNEAGRQFYYPQKPHWVDLLENCNRILEQSQNPVSVRKYHDELLSVAHQADNIFSGILKVAALDRFVVSIPDESCLRPLREIFELKRQYEVKSSQSSGSMPSTQCNQMRRYTKIVESLDKRLKLLAFSASDKTCPDLGMKQPYNSGHFFR